MKPIPTEWTICRPEDGIATERSIRIRIDDEGGGAFIVAESFCEEAVRLDASEVAPFIDALLKAHDVCKRLNDEQEKAKAKAKAKLAPKPAPKPTETTATQAPF